MAWHIGSVGRSFPEGRPRTSVIDLALTPPSIDRNCCCTRQRCAKATLSAIPVAWFLNREDGRIVGQMGTMGENGGQFFGLHMIAVDSKGTIYTGEVFAGERVQRFHPIP